MFGMIAMMKEKLSSSRIFCSHTMMMMNYLFLHTHISAMIYVNVCMKIEEERIKIRIEIFQGDTKKEENSAWALSAMSS